MRRLLLAVVAFVCAVVLSSCSLLSGGSLVILANDRELANARMEQIADALNDQDAAALKAMFSPYALEQAVDIDERLDYLLSFFPNGGVTWEYDVVGGDSTRSDGKWTELLPAYYTVSADGNEYTFFFADFTVNDVVNPDNVGIYAMGVTPWTDEHDIGPAQLFFAWAGSMSADERFEKAYPGVYFPEYDSTELSDGMMAAIAWEVGTQDPVGLREKFTEYARSELAMEIDGKLDALFALFPDRDVAWEKLREGPVVREATDGDDQTMLLLSTYRVSSAGKDFWLSFAYFPLNGIDPSNQGIYAIGVAPRTESEDSAAEQALSAWADSFDVSASPPPGIVVPD
jgi:hypothetical protein